MLKRFGSHFCHNHLIACLALFFALGGTALAGKQITGADVQDGSLTGADVSDASTLKGVDIDESDLGKVPSAANADNADTLDGLDSDSFPRVFAGRVTRLGAVEQGTGFTADQGPNFGTYDITFPPGTFSGCHLPIATVTVAEDEQSGQFGGTDSFAVIVDRSCNDDGSAAFTVLIVREGDQSGPRTVALRPFQFIAL